MADVNPLKVPDNYRIAGGLMMLSGFVNGALSLFLGLYLLIICIGLWYVVPFTLAVVEFAMGVALLAGVKHPSLQMAPGVGILNGALMCGSIPAFAINGIAFFLLQQEDVGEWLKTDPRDFLNSAEGKRVYLRDRFRRSLVSKNIALAEAWRRASKASDGTPAGVRALLAEHLDDVESELKAKGRAVRPTHLETFEIVALDPGEPLDADNLLCVPEGEKGVRLRDAIEDYRAAAAAEAELS